MPSGKTHTAAENRLIHHGATAAELADIFGFKTAKEVLKRISGKVNQVGDDGKATYYRIADAAPFLTEQTAANIDQVLASMSPSRLPPTLQKAYWESHLTRQKVEQNRNNLWSTDRVFDMFADVLKELRQGVLVFEDTIEQEVGITPEQRGLIRRMSDNLLESLYRRLTDNYSFYAPSPDEHGIDPTARPADTE